MTFLRVLMAVGVILAWMAALVFLTSAVFMIAFDQLSTTPTLCHYGSHRC